MQTVLLVLHLIIAAGLVGVVLLQRSEGGALGIGGSGGGGGGFLTGRGTANLLTRITAGLAAAFFVTSLALTMLAQGNANAPNIVGRGAATPVSAPATTPGAAPVAPPADPTAPPVPAVPAGTPPAAPATPPAKGGIFDRFPGQTGTPPAK